MVEGGRGPACGRVTRSALGAKAARMNIVFSMAGGAVFGRAFENAVDMTTVASRCSMFSLKRECELGVIYLGEVPSIGYVTGDAVCPKSAVVLVILCVAGKAVLRGGF